MQTTVHHHTVTVLPVAVRERPTAAGGMLPVPDQYTLERLAILAANEVSAGDLVVGSVAPLRRSGALAPVAWLCGPFVAQPGPYDADCPLCRAEERWYDAPAVALRPHYLKQADALVAIVSPSGPVEPVPPVCVNVCGCGDGPGSPSGWYPRSTCPECHGRPCAACLAGSTH
jgi:hypothetical protein